MDAGVLALPLSFGAQGHNTMARFLLIVSLSLLTSGASAQQQKGHDACARDVSRLCRTVMNDGDSAVLACLRQHRARLSKACDKVLTDNGQ